MTRPPYRGYKARSADLTRRRPRPRRTEILRVMPDGSRRFLGRRCRDHWAEAAAASPVIARLRSDAADRVMTVVRLLGARACYADGTVLYPRDQLCADAGISVSTWKAIRKVLERAQLLAVVTTGRKYWHGEQTRSDAAIYVITAPVSLLRKIGVKRRRAAAYRKSRPPTVSAEVSNISTRANDVLPGHRGPPSGRAHPGGRPPSAAAGRAGRAAGAVAEAIRQWAGQGISEGWVSYLAAILAPAGWSGDDVTEALGYAGWEGRAHPYLRATMRHPDAVLRHRLLRYWFDGTAPLPSPSQRRAAAAEQRAADQAASKAAGITARTAGAAGTGRAIADAWLAEQAAQGNKAAAAVIMRRRGTRTPGPARPPPVS